MLTRNQKKARTLKLSLPEEFDLRHLKNAVDISNVVRRQAGKSDLSLETFCYNCIVNGINSAYQYVDSKTKKEEQTNDGQGQASETV